MLFIFWFNKTAKPMPKTTDNGSAIKAYVKVTFNDFQKTGSEKRNV